jgi:hypothetical protein
VPNKRFNHLRWDELSVEPNCNARSCISVRNRSNALTLLELCSMHGTRESFTYQYTCAGSCDELFTTSTQLSYDLDERSPSRELRNAIIYCCKR